MEKFTLETYAQGGYVLGPNETYFFDGSAALQRPIAELGRTKLSVGPGAWAGGQRKVSRMDIGPRADLSVPLGTMSARIALDWRVRGAGNARPGNGAAITVSTGFLGNGDLFLLGDRDYFVSSRQERPFALHKKSIIRWLNGH